MLLRIQRARLRQAVTCKQSSSHKHEQHTQPENLRTSRLDRYSRCTFDDQKAVLTFCVPLCATVLVGQKPAQTGKLLALYERSATPAGTDSAKDQPCPQPKPADHNNKTYHYRNVTHENAGSRHVEDTTRQHETIKGVSTTLAFVQSLLSSSSKRQTFPEALQVLLMPFVIGVA